MTAEVIRGWVPDDKLEKETLRQISKETLRRISEGEACGYGVYSTKTQCFSGGLGGARKCKVTVAVEYL